MKSIITLFALISLSEFSFAQSISAKDVLQQPDSVTWSKYETVNQKELNSVLRFMHNDSIHNFWGSNINLTWQEKPFEFYTFALYHKPFIHLIDLDNDKDLDVIYDGREFPGLEAGSVMVFSNDKKRYNFLFSVNGTTQRIYKKQDNTWKIETMTYPCCSEFRFALNEYELSSDEGRMKSTLLTSTGFLWIDNSENALEITKELKSKTLTAVSSQKAYLHAYPVVSTQIPDLSEKYFEDHFSPDYVAEVPENIPMQVLIKTVDNNGDEWLFVLVKVSDAAAHIFYKDLGYDDVNVIGGWMKADTSVSFIRASH